MSVSQFAIGELVHRTCHSIYLAFFAKDRRLSFDMLMPSVNWSNL